MRLKKSRKTVINYFTILIAVFLLPLSAYPQDDESSLTLVHDSISMVDLLQEIEDKTSYYFLYSPDDMQDRFVKVRFQEQNVKYILNQLFNDDLTYSRSGYEVVIFKNRSSDDAAADVAPPTSDTVDHEEKSGASGTDILRVDTVYQVRYDTILMKDTIVIRDTIMITDTIYKQRVVKNAHKKKISFENTLLDQRHQKKYYLSFHLGPVIGNTVYKGNNRELVDRYSDAFSGAMSYSMGVAGGIRKKNLFAETGLAIRKVREGFEYTFEQPRQTYYETDTLDTYYTVDNGQDTTWYYVTDSTQQVTPGYEEYYDNTNEYTFLDIPVYAGYRVMLGRIDLEMKAGLIVETLLKKEGYAIVDQEHYPVKKLADINSNLGLSGAIEVGGVYNVNNSLGAFAKVNMRTSFVDVFKDTYPLERNSSQVYLKVGLRASF